MTHLEDRLANWGRCMRDSWKQGRCRSIEHRYLPERIVGESWESRQKPRTVLDHRDAALVEAAWRKVTPRIQQQVLKLHYVWGAAPPFICRRLGIQQCRDDTYYLLELGRAHAAVSRLLEPVWRETLDTELRLHMGYR